MLPFDDKKLVDKFGSWVRVQVEFYDFLFESATQLSVEKLSEEFKDQYANAVTEGFADGEDLYEKSVEAIEAVYKTPEESWQKFVEHVNQPCDCDPDGD
jgi:hypothetical protein